MIKAEKKIKIGGKNRLLKMGTNATAMFCDMYEIPLSEFQTYMSNQTMSHYRDLIYCAVADGARKEGKEVNFDRYEVGDWLDEEGIMEKVMEFFNSIQAPQQNQQSGGEGNKKK